MQKCLFSNKSDQNQIVLQHEFVVIMIENISKFVSNNEFTYFCWLNCVVDYLFYLNFALKWHVFGDTKILPDLVERHIDLVESWSGWVRLETFKPSKSSFFTPKNKKQQFKTVNNNKINKFSFFSGAMMFHNYIKIVPTTYVKADGSFLQTNQFSVTRHQRQIKMFAGETKMPGIFFSYELSPLMVKFTEKVKSFGHFATNVCAIVGGVFTVAGLVDSFLYHSLRAIQKKIELGKFS